MVKIGAKITLHSTSELSVDYNHLTRELEKPNKSLIAGYAARCCAQMLHAVCSKTYVVALVMLQCFEAFANENENAL